MSFGAIADEYNRLRPSPPEQAVDWLLPARCQVAVDLAAGTGLLTRALAAKVSNVVAVEPDGRMGAVLRDRSPGVAVVAGKGEAIPLAAASTDAVFISSAWHWLNPDLAGPEIARVLRPGGRFGVIWTSRDREVDWVRDIDWIREPGARQAAEAPPRRRHREVTLPDRGLFRDIEATSFTFTRTMAIGDVVDMVGTYSGIITASDTDRAVALARVRASLDERFAGQAEIDVPMRSWCWRATVAARLEFGPAFGRSAGGQTRSARNASTCWLNSSGWSMLLMCPASGITARTARGTLAAR